MRPTPVRHVSVAERRSRLGRRHRLARLAVGDVVETARSLVCLHATDPATVYLSAWARTQAFETADLDTALYEDRSLVKHLAMRRTLFVFPRDLLAAAHAGATRFLAETERRGLLRDVGRARLRDNPEAWLHTAAAEVEAALASRGELTSRQLQAELPSLAGMLRYGEGRSWAGRMSLAPRVLTVMVASGRVLRTGNDGPWYTSRPRFALTRHWLGHDLEDLDPAAGRHELVARWLAAFGPGTVADLRWWLGSTIAAVHESLAAVGAAPVSLDGATGYLLPDDLDEVPPPEPWAALLPPLDPTTMGWYGRDWYLGAHRPLLFDTAGNGGPTVWVDGRIVGSWAQRPDGSLAVELLDDVGAERGRLVEAERGRLERWLAGRKVLLSVPAPLWAERDLSAGR